MLDNGRCDLCQCYPPCDCGQYDVAHVKAAVDLMKEKVRDAYFEGYRDGGNAVADFNRGSKCRSDIDAWNDSDAKISIM